MMAFTERVRGGFPRKVFALAAMLISLSSWFAVAGDHSKPTCGLRQCKNGCLGHHGRDRIPGSGPLGYGPPGIYPGFQGFGLGYHLGYGYGGKALGTPEGGYPFYGGPGYPHPAPRLKRIGGINPFPHFAGPGYPTPDQPHYYGFVGPLVVDRPVISATGGANDPSTAQSYGDFTGALPYPDSKFAPFTSEASGAKLEMNPMGASPIVVPSRATDVPLPKNPSDSGTDDRSRQNQ